MNNNKYRNSQWINKIFDNHALCSVRSPFSSILHSILSFVAIILLSFFILSFSYSQLDSFFSIFSIVCHVLSFLPSIQLRWFGRAPKKKKTKKSGTICSTVYLIVVVGYLQKIKTGWQSFLVYSTFCCCTIDGKKIAPSNPWWKWRDRITVYLITFVSDSFFKTNIRRVLDTIPKVHNIKKNEEMLLHDYGLKGLLLSFSYVNAITFDWMEER